jgi:hypothetical protein
MPKATTTTNPPQTANTLVSTIFLVLCPYFLLLLHSCFLLHAIAGRAAFAAAFPILNYAGQRWDTLLLFSVKLPPAHTLSFVPSSSSATAARFFFSFFSLSPCLLPPASRPLLQLAYLLPSRPRVSGMQPQPASYRLRQSAPVRQVRPPDDCRNYISFYIIIIFCFCLVFLFSS